MKWQIIIALCIAQQACSQANPNQQFKVQGNVGGRCEGCEAIYESPIPFDQLNHIDTLPGFEAGKEKIKISGKVLQPDGATPAAGVILYFYQTNEQGIYPVRGGEKDWSARHGYIRGWIRTNNKGEYEIYMFRPGSYPNSRNPQHIHFTVKEKDMNEYYIDDILFADDPYLPENPGNRTPRGGNGIVQPKMENGLLVVKRDIMLGKNIPGHPGKKE